MIKQDSTRKQGERRGLEVCELNFINTSYNYHYASDVNLSQTHSKYIPPLITVYVMDQRDLERFESPFQCFEKIIYPSWQFFWVVL